MDNHFVTVENRKFATITDVVEVDSFDDNEIRATLSQGSMIIKGEMLKLKALDLEKGTAQISGSIDSLMYLKIKEKGQGTLVARLLK